MAPANGLQSLTKKMGSDAEVMQCCDCVCVYLHVLELYGIYLTSMLSSADHVIETSRVKILILVVKTHLQSCN